MDILNYIRKQTDGIDTIFWQGPINEHWDESVEILPKDLTRECIFNLKNIDYINSLGIRLWINFLRDIQDGRRIRFTECPSMLILQINMIPDFGGSAEIESFYADFYCDNCGHEDSQMFESSSGYDGIVDDCSKRQCSECQETMELEDSCEIYFDFLKRSSSAA